MNQEYFHTLNAIILPHDNARMNKVYNISPCRIKPVIRRNKASMLLYVFKGSSYSTYLCWWETMSDMSQVTRWHGAASVHLKSSVWNRRRTRDLVHTIYPLETRNQIKFTLINDMNILLDIHSQSRKALQCTDVAQPRVVLAIQLVTIIIIKLHLLKCLLIYYNYQLKTTFSLIIISTNKVISYLQLYWTVLSTRMCLGFHHYFGSKAKKPGYIVFYAG